MTSHKNSVDTPPRAKRQQAVKLRTPLRRVHSHAIAIRRPPSAITSAAVHIRPPPSVLERPNRPQRRRRPRKPRINQKPSTPTSTPRRSPRTPRHSLRSTRNEPPRFGNDNLDDDLAARGSPVPPDYYHEVGFDGDFDIDDNQPMDIEQLDDPVMEPAATLMAKHAAIMESIRKIVPQYWDLLDESPLSLARISERCFVIQDLDQKKLCLKVSLRSFYIAHI